MAEWRPDGWNNPHEPLQDASFIDLADAHFRTLSDNKYVAFEAGADAMLDALKAKGQSDQEKVWPIEPVEDGLGQGTWVFIPDDEVKGK